MILIVSRYAGFFAISTECLAAPFIGSCAYASAIFSNVVRTAGSCVDAAACSKRIVKRGGSTAAPAGGVGGFQGVVGALMAAKEGGSWMLGGIGR